MADRDDLMENVARFCGAMALKGYGSPKSKDWRNRSFVMSWMPSADPIFGDRKSCDALELVVVPRVRDLGDGFEVRRALPSDRRQMASCAGGSYPPLRKVVADKIMVTTKRPVSTPRPA